jgi:plasmid segregation protein ParM
MDTVIALDVGHSAVKVVADAGGHRHHLMFRSVAIPAFPISEDSARAAADRDTVTVAGQPYFFGDTAVVQGRSDVESALSEGWITTPQYAALFLGAVKRLSLLPTPITSDKAMLVVGLPAKFFTQQRNLLKTTLQQHLPGAEIIVRPQPMGPYCCIQFNADGTENRDHNMGDESWGVVEVGHFTSDFALFKGGVWTEHGSGSCKGGYVAAGELSRLLQERDNISVSPLEATAAIESGSIRIYGKKVNIKPYLQAAGMPIAAEILEHATRLMERDARALDGIIIAGGGAPLVYHQLQAKWPHTVLADNSRMTVAEGFCRLGCALRADRRQRVARAAAESTQLPARS